VNTERSKYTTGVICTRCICSMLTFRFRSFSVNVSNYSCITYLILFRIYFKNDCQKEVIFIFMRSKFRSAVLWVVCFITDTECGANLFWNFKGNDFNFSENRFSYFWRYLGVFSSVSLAGYPIAAECFASGYVAQFSRTNICLPLLVTYNANCINDKLSSRRR
jgi:hypothetical protein